MAKKLYTVKVEMRTVFHKEIYVEAENIQEAKKKFQEAKKNDEIFDGEFDYSGDLFDESWETKPVFKSIKGFKSEEMERECWRRSDK